jgi:glutaredoxin
MKVVKLKMVIGLNVKKNNMYKIGADPEVFIFNTTSNKIVSVEGMIKTPEGEGTKQHPLVVEGEFKLQEDNVLAEYNIPACSTLQEWLDAHDFMLNAINVFVPDDCSYKIQASATLDDEFLQSDQAKEIGCESDYNVWLEEENKSLEEYPSNLRCAGGHIHLGIPEDEQDIENLQNIIKKMDMFLGVPSIILDDDKERRSVYGKAGAFRFKPYGLEYRTLSNFWLSSKELMTWAYNQTMLAIESDIEIDSEAEKIINSQDVNKAYSFCDKYNITLPLKLV